MNVLVGCRVVRGPDWKWNDQDGGEGSVGTIVSTDTFSDGKPLNQQTVLVHWDTGTKLDYRLGLDGKYELKILDSAPSGVFFNDVMCGGCGQNPLLGTRWQCADCEDYDLCTNCYSNDIHDVDHNFKRYDHHNLQSIDVGKRSSSVKIQAKGIFPGSEVTNGKDSGYDLGSMTGSVIMDHRMSDDIPVGKVLVEWGDEPNSSTKIEHNVGYDGKVDVKLERFAPDIHYYYRDHLLIPSIALDTDEKFQVKDKVTVHLDLNDLHQITHSIYGHWEPEMERGISEVGTVEKVDESGVTVKFENSKEAHLLFPHGALTKVPDLGVEDRVKISDNEEKLEILQKGHGEWKDETKELLGKEGVVLKIDEDGDACVDAGEKIWWFNPAVLILQSKKEEEKDSVDTLETEYSKEGNPEEEDHAEEARAVVAGGELAKKKSKKSFAEKVLEVLPDPDELFKNGQQVVSEVTKELKKILQNVREKAPITITLGNNPNSGKIDDEKIQPSEDDCSIGARSCLPLQPALSMNDLDVSDDEDENGVRPVISTNLDEIPPDYRPNRIDNVYKMTSYPRDVAFIVNIEQFDIKDPEHPMYGKLENRVGSKKDEEDVNRLFYELHFVVETIDKTSGDELLAELTRISKEYDFSEFDCFVLFIMSHGAKNCIYASDGKQLPPSLIISSFRNYKCKTLEGKPKLFFFQGCRGEKEDKGPMPADSPEDGSRASATQTTELNHADDVTANNDILEFYSSYVGYTAYRDPEIGSPFIQNIDKVFRKYACKKSITGLITKVTLRISKGEYCNRKQTPQFISSLKKEL